MLLPVQIHDAIIAHARYCLPNEACGLLATDGDGHLRFVYCLTNTAASPRRFRIEPVEHFGAARHAEQRSWVISGAFHSHVASPARPSRVDIAQPVGADWLHLLVGPMDGVPEVRAYRIRDGAAEELPAIVG